VTLYVTGGMGFLGSNIIKVAQERHQKNVFASVFRNKPQAAQFEYGVVDLCDRAQVLDSVKSVKPEAIIHTAILNDFSKIYADRHAGWQSYIDATRYLIEAAQQVGAKMILVSTDWVFDGTQVFADEATPPNPINYYGVLKAIGENMLTSIYDNTAVARVSGVYGTHWAQPEQPMRQNAGQGNLCNATVDHLKLGKQFNLWTEKVNQKATSTLASDGAEMILKINEKDERGIFHCCGGQSHTRFELAQATAKAFELDAGLIQLGPTDWNDPASLKAFPIPVDSTLNAKTTSKKLEHSLLSLDEALGQFKKEYETATL